MTLRVAGRLAIVLTLVWAATEHGRAQQAAPGVPDQPVVLDTFAPGVCSANGQAFVGCAPGSVVRIRVDRVATGLGRPVYMAFLPGEEVLLAVEAPGQVRVVRNGVLDTGPVPGWPVETLNARGLLGIVIHPAFEQTRLVYLSYVKQGPLGEALAIARGRFDGQRLSDVEDVFVADTWGQGGTFGGRMGFGPDGRLYVAHGDRDAQAISDDNTLRMRAQNLRNHVGKVLRLEDDGRVPADNPFVGRSGAKPEIYTYGHRNVYGLAWHADTGELWATEIGPMGGDELNVLQPGKNYGWPLVSLGRNYTGKTVSEASWYLEGMEMPAMFWVPAISPASLIYCTGNQFPEWQGDFFLGALSGQMLQRVAFGQAPPQAERRESLLIPLGLRIRDVAQAPDGTLWVTTEDSGPYRPAGPDSTSAILRIERAN